MRGVFNKGWGVEDGGVGEEDGMVGGYNDADAGGSSK